MRPFARMSLIVVFALLIDLAVAQVSAAPDRVQHAPGSDAVSIVFEDSRGALWNGTGGFSVAGGGLNQLDRATDQDRALWSRELSPGQYQLVLTSHQTPGVVSIYLKDR